ncbi:hypothetical protein GE061_015182, partial [Apolygus lucorum]
AFKISSQLSGTFPLFSTRLIRLYLSPHRSSSFSNYPEETIIVNTLAMVLVALAILVSYAVRREPLRVHSISYVSERL